MGLGDVVTARRLLNAAIADLDLGLARPSVRGGVPDEAWVEYTVMIKQAAGALGDHRLVLELHRRWPGQEYAMGLFVTGVACFNLRKYEQAGRYWQRIADREWQRPMQAYIGVTSLMNDGLVPAFPLEYDPLEKELSAKYVEAIAQALAESGRTRISYLAFLFESANGQVAQMTDLLIAHSGEWGIELGRRLLAGATVKMSVKMGAARALTDLGIFGPEEPIPIIHEGRPTSVVLKQIEFEEESPELDSLLAEAVSLRDAGQADQAYQMLHDLYVQGVAYPPAMITLANLMWNRGEMDSTRNILELLAKSFPDEPGVLFNLAGLWLQLGDLDQARQYAEQIRPEGMGPTFADKLGELRAMLRSQGSPFDKGRIADAYREHEEEKPISTAVKLGPALKRVPVQWLNAAATVYRLEQARLRSAREKLLGAALSDPEQILMALEAEFPTATEVLRYVLEQGGWCKLQALTRRWGSLERDGFWWDEAPPISTVGRLRVLGLLFVGRCQVNGRSYKVAVVPSNLRDLLKRILLAL